MQIFLVIPQLHQILANRAAIEKRLYFLNITFIPRVIALCVEHFDSRTNQHIWQALVFAYAMVQHNCIEQNAKGVG
jgi:hypothetical protein